MGAQYFPGYRPRNNIYGFGRFGDYGATNAGAGFEEKKPEKEDQEDITSGKETAANDSNREENAASENTQSTSDTGKTETVRNDRIPVHGFNNLFPYGGWVCFAGYDVKRLSPKSNTE